MPRIDFKLWNRVYILKLICTAQMTYSCFVTLVYFYLLILQSWTCWESERSDILTFKWSVVVVSILEFGLGTLLAFAANLTGIRCRRGIVAWIILETFLVPTSIFLLMQLYYKIVKATTRYSTDPHYSRVNIAQVCFLLCQYIFIGYALDFLVHAERKPKMYDPSIRPESIYAPTDPQITTTESRHIRMSQSFLFQPSSSKKHTMAERNDESPSSSETKFSNEEAELRNDEEYSRHKPEKENELWMKDEAVAWLSNENSSQSIPALNTGKVEEETEQEAEEWMGDPDRDDKGEKKGKQ